ncbi:MAG: SRPBCC family protein, partial [Dehalococcoidia bacterium]
MRLSFAVACSAEQAFATWTARTSLWWPREHTVAGEPGLEVCFEPRVGGRVFERTASGREMDWGEVTAWEPPRLLGCLWHLRRDRADATDVELRFTATGDSDTHLAIEH